MHLTVGTTSRIEPLSMVSVDRGPRAIPRGGRGPSTPTPPCLKHLLTLRALRLPALNDRKEKGGVLLRRGYSGTLDNQIPLYSHALSYSTEIFVPVENFYRRSLASPESCLDLRGP